MEKENNFFEGNIFTESMAELVQRQKKMVDGFEVLTNLDFDERFKTPKEIVYEEDKMKVYRFLPTVPTKAKTPTLLVYAMMNRPYIMDLQSDRSFVKKLLDEGLDLYMVDWGYPTAEDRYITIEDYIEGYLGNAVDFIRESRDKDQINFIAKCQGGTYSTIYSSIYPEKVKNLVTVAAPFEFDIDEGLLYKWTKYMDVDSLVDAYGIVPGDFLNATFVQLRPYTLLVDKYVSVVNSLDNPDRLKNFMSLEQWIFDSPGQAGEAYRQFMKDFWQENKLIKGEFYLGDKKIDLRNVTMPLLNVVGDKDNLIPPASSIPLNDHVGSKDKELVSFPVGHAGIVASGRSQREIVPKIAEWILKRD